MMNTQTHTRANKLEHGLYTYLLAQVCVPCEARGQTSSKMFCRPFGTGVPYQYSSINRAISTTVAAVVAASATEHRRCCLRTSSESSGDTASTSGAVESRKNFSTSHANKYVPGNVYSWPNRIFLASLDVILAFVFVYQVRDEYAYRPKCSKYPIYIYMSTPSFGDRP